MFISNFRKIVVDGENSVDHSVCEVVVGLLGVGDPGFNDVWPEIP